MQQYGKWNITILTILLNLKFKIIEKGTSWNMKKEQIELTCDVTKILGSNPKKVKNFF